MTTFICPEEGELSNVLRMETDCSTVLLEQLAGGRDDIQDNDRIEINRQQAAQLAEEILCWLLKDDEELVKTILCRMQSLCES